MNIIFLRQQSHLSSDQVDAKTGKFKGVAYTGDVISQHGFIKNLIIDLKSLSVAKQKTPILRDHFTNQVSGSGKVTIGEKVLIEGNLSLKSSYGKEIVDLSDDGIDWELSLGVYGGTLREFENETINGIEIPSGTVLENGVIREVSFVILGADSGTSTEIFDINNKKENLEMKLNQHGDWEKFACSCGGKKDSTPEDLAKKFEENSEEIKEKEAEISEKQAEIDKLKAEIEALKKESEEEERAAEMSAAAKEKNFDISEEAIKLASKSKEATDAVLLAIKGMKKVSLANDPKFKEKVIISSDKNSVENDSEKIRLAAEKMVKDGLAVDFMDAVNKLEVKGA